MALNRDARMIEATAQDAFDRYHDGLPAHMPRMLESSRNDYNRVAAECDRLITRRDVSGSRL